MPPETYKLYAEALQTNGYVIVPNILNKDEVTKLNAYVIDNADYYGRNEFEGEKTKRIYSLITKSRLFDTLIGNQDLIVLLEKVLGNGILISRSQSISIYPGESKQRLHRDAMAFPLQKEGTTLGVSVIVALNDFTEENGSTNIIPKSHLWSEERQALEEELMPVKMRKGSALIFLDRLYHCGGENTTNSVRSAIFLHYTVPWIRQIDNIMPYFPFEIAKRLPLAIQRLIGYDIYDNNGIVYGVINGRHPQKFLQ